MDDLISRQAALDAIFEYIDEYGDLDQNGLHNPKWCAMCEAKMVLEDLPSVQPEWNDLLVICANCGHTIHVAKDAQHIIRCKDCKHWKHDHTCREHSLVSPMSANEFCSRAERRTDG